MGHFFKTTFLTNMFRIPAYRFFLHLPVEEETIKANSAL